MPKPPSTPIEGSEVVADESLERRQRRSFSAQFKRRILEQAAACQSHGEVAALLRKHGLYSSHLAQWRALFAEDNAKLAARLELSEKIVAFQKKAQELFAALSAQTTR